jgi:hypothetical protein
VIFLGKDYFEKRYRGLGNTIRLTGRLFALLKTWGLRGFKSRADEYQLIMQVALEA